MATDLAHMGMPKPDGIVRLLFFEATEPIPLAVLLVRTRSQVNTILTVLRIHGNNLRMYVVQLIVDSRRADNLKSVDLSLLSQ